MIKKKNLSEYIPFTLHAAQDIRIGIVVSEWNSDITDLLLKGAGETLAQQGVVASHISIEHVPGSYELATGAALMLDTMPSLDAVICLGCIVQGETRHFEFIAQAAAHGIMNVSLQYRKPVLFGVLTCNTVAQAMERAGGKHGNKGVEAAVSCLKMIELQRKLHGEHQ